MLHYLTVAVGLEDKELHLGEDLVQYAGNDNSLFFKEIEDYDRNIQVASHVSQCIAVSGWVVGTHVCLCISENQHRQIFPSVITMKLQFNFISCKVISTAMAYSLRSSYLCIFHITLEPQKRYEYLSKEITSN